MATSIYDIYANEDKRNNAKETVKNLGRSGLGMALPIAGLAYGLRLNKGDLNQYLFEARNKRGMLARQAGQQIRSSVLGVYQPNADALIDRAAALGQRTMNLVTGNEPLANMLNIEVNDSATIKKAKEETMAILQTIRTRTQDLIPQGQQASNQIHELINQLDEAVNNIDTLFTHVQDKNATTSQKTRDLYDQTNAKLVEFAKQYGNSDRNRNSAFGNTFKQYRRISENFFSDKKRNELLSMNKNLVMAPTKTNLGLDSFTSHNVYGSGAPGNFINNRNIFSQDFQNIDDVINALQTKHAGFSSTQQMKNITENIRRRHTDLSKIMHNSGRFQIVQEFKDTDKVVSSVYYLPKFGNKEVPIALHLSRDANTGVSYYRSTGQMGARYAMPNTFYDAQQLQDIMKMNSRGQQIEALQAATQKGSFEDFQISFFRSIQSQKQRLGSQLSSNSLSGDEVNEILDFFRSTGVTSERRTSDIISDNTTHFNKFLQRNLRNAEAIQANRPIIYNTNKLGNRNDRLTFLSKLVSSNLGFEGVIGASTQTTDLEMKAMGGMFSYGSAGVRYNMGLDKSGNITKDLAFNPMNSIQSIGVMNRAVQPLVAREHQYHGKKELVMGFTNKTSSDEIAKDIYDVERKRFGRFNQVKTFGTGEDLIGISGNKIGKEMVGVNVQGLLIVDDDLALNIGGFGEGAGFYGGRPIVRQAKDKTIIHTDYTPTTALTEYIATKQKTKQGDVFLSNKKEIQQFFEMFGSTLGEGDAGSLVDIKRLTSMHQLTIKMGEATPDLSRHKISFVLESVNVEGGPKLFGPMVKHTGSTMPMLTSDIAEEVIGRVMMSGKDFDKIKGEDLYVNPKAYQQDLESKSRNLFGKSYAALTPEEQKQVETKAKVQKITQVEIEKNFGIKYENTILTDYGQAKKSAYHSTTSAAGGLMSLGFSREELKKAGMFTDLADPISGKTFSELTEMDSFDMESLQKYSSHMFGGKKYEDLTEAEQGEIDKVFKQFQAEDFSSRKSVEHFVETSFQVVRNNLNKKVYRYKKTEVIASNLAEAQNLIYNEISRASNFKDTIDPKTKAVTMTAAQKRNQLRSTIATAGSVIDVGHFKPSAFSMGLVFGGLRYMTEKKGKFGFKKDKGDFEALLSKFSQGIYSNEEQEAMLRASKLGVTINASYAQIGPVASVLGNNLAAIEPRISNFYLNRLVTEFGMNADEATNNLGSLLVRQKGFGEKLALMEQMRLTTLSMSPLADNIKYNAEVEELLRTPVSSNGKQQLRELTKQETAELLDIASRQDNTSLKEFLSSFDVQKGVVVNTENLSDNKNVQKQIEKIIGNKQSIILPAGKPVEFLSSTSIKKAVGSSGGDEIIENDVLRLINDTFLHINTASHRKDPAYLLGTQSEEGRIQVYMGKLQEQFGNLYRNLNTLDIQGSSTIEGGGITLSADSPNIEYYHKSATGMVSSYSFVHKNPEMNRIQVGRMQQAFNEARGFAGFMDTQAYVNTLTDFMGGIKSDTKWRIDQGYLSDSEKRYFDSQKAKGRKQSEIIEKMSTKFYRESLSNFLLGMEEGVAKDPMTGKLQTTFKPLGITGTSIRNPALSPGNVNIGMQMFKMVDDSVTDTITGDYALNKVLQRKSEGNIMLGDLTKYVKSNAFIKKMQTINGGAEIMKNLGLDVTKPDEFKFTNFNQLRILNDLGSLDEFKDKNISMSVIDEDTGKIKTEVIQDPKDPNKKISVRSRKDRKLKAAVGDVLTQYVDTLREVSGVGGGKMYYVNQNVDVEFEYKDGNQTKTHTYKNKRVDFSRYGIGDYDGDIYAWINSTNNQLKKKLYEEKEGEEIIGKMHRYGTEFLMYFDLLGEGMDSIDKQFGNVEKSVKFLQSDDQLKEQLIKSVGGLDVAVKTVIMGNLNQIREYQHKGRGGTQFDTSIRKNMSSIALLSTSVEILNIKAKKLKQASNVTDMLKSAIKSDLDKGGIENTKKFYKDLFRGTKYENEIKITKFNMLNVPHSSSGAQIHKNAVEGLTFSLDNAIEGMLEGVRAVREGKLEYLSSDKRAAGLMSSVDELSDAGAFQKAMNPFTTETLEGALINGTRQGDLGLVEDFLDDFGEQLDRQHFAMENLSMKSNRNSMFAIGAGVLGAGYLLGPSMDTSPLEGPGQFSDYKINKRIAEGTLYEKMKQDKDVAVNQIPTMSRDLFVNRQVNYNETYMSQNNNYLMFGELNTINSLPSAASMIARNGGSASIRISDNRMPITGSYVDRLLGER